MDWGIVSLKLAGVSLYITRTTNLMKTNAIDRYSPVFWVESSNGPISSPKGICRWPASTNAIGKLLNNLMDVHSSLLD